MRHALRSRGLALATLATFLLAQPAVWCAALCAVERHHGAGHVMHGMDPTDSALGNADCHTGNGGSVQRAPVEVLSPMAPARPAVIAAAPARWVEPARALPIPPPHVPHTVDPPPPRPV